LQLIGAHGTTPHPIQSFACLQEAAIADALANYSATKIPHSKYCTVTKVQITAPVSIKNLLRGQATNSIMNVTEWAIQIKTLGNKLVSQTGPICKVKGLTELAAMMIKIAIRSYTYILDMVTLIDTMCLSSVIHW
jgi:hypothetical protein